MTLSLVFVQVELLRDSVSAERDAAAASVAVARAEVLNKAAADVKAANGALYASNTDTNVLKRVWVLWCSEKTAGAVPLNPSLKSNVVLCGCPSPSSFPSPFPHPHPPTHL